MLLHLRDVSRPCSTRVPLPSLPLRSELTPPKPPSSLLPPPLPLSNLHPRAPSRLLPHRRLLGTLRRGHYLGVPPQEPYWRGLDFTERQAEQKRVVYVMLYVPGIIPDKKGVGAEESSAGFYDYM